MAVKGGFDAVCPGKQAVAGFVCHGKIRRVNVYDQIVVEDNIRCGPDISGKQNHIGVELFNKRHRFLIICGADFAVLERLFPVGIILADVDGFPRNIILFGSGDSLGVGVVCKNADNLKWAAHDALLHLLLELVGFPERVAGSRAIAEHAGACRGPD